MDNNLQRSLHVHARAVLSMLLSLSLSMPAYAQLPTDAGALIKQVDERREMMQQDRELPRPQLKETGLTTPTKHQVKITVTGFRFKGNTLLGDKELSTIVKRYLNHAVTYSQLQDAAAAVGEAYRKRGWAVRAFLPQQDIANGIVEIDIVEARLGKILLEKDSCAWPSKARIDAMFKAQGKEGKPLNVDTLERPLLILDDLPGVSASGRLQQGEHDGETDLVIKTAKDSWASGVVMADNEGSRSTSEYRVHSFVQLLNPLKLGDISSLYLLESEGLRFARLEESLSVGSDGLRIGANAGVSDYKVLPSEFDALNAKGKSNSVGAQVSYPLIRSRQQNLNFNFNYDHKSFYNRAQDDTSSKYETDSCTMALRGNKVDAFFGGGSNFANVNFVLGKQSLGTLNSGEDPALQGGYQKVVYNFSRQQTILSWLSAYGEASGQVTPDRRLDSSEKFYLGGPGGVRAYPVSEGSGVQGVLYKAELRCRLASKYQLSGFYDYGFVRNYGNVRSYSLDGAGLESYWQLNTGLGIKLTWAHRLHENSNSTSNGDDQDGTLRKDRFWLSCIVQF
ncbi:MAG: ShlB/FhaC/HecB family hemolysin secretion/activation protein [Candidatus Omnitrophota bacterium]